MKDSSSLRFASCQYEIGAVSEDRYEEKRERSSMGKVGRKGAAEDGKSLGGNRKKGIRMIGRNGDESESSFKGLLSLSEKLKTHGNVLR